MYFWSLNIPLSRPPPPRLACVSGLRGACYASLRVCERVGLLGVGLWVVWARVLPYGRTGALPAG
eukprot:1738508-Prymnesium_polylepis.1